MRLVSRSLWKSLRMSLNGWQDSGVLPSFARKQRRESTDVLRDRVPSADTHDLLNGRDEDKIHGWRHRGRNCCWRGRKRLLFLIILTSFLLGYYAQVLVFFCHVRLGYPGEVLPTREVTLAEKFTDTLIHMTKRVMFVCKRTNWDYVGLVASPHVVLFAHDDVEIPAPLDDSLSIVRHSGTDSYMNLHNKTLTIMSHVHRADPQLNFFKQDDEVVIFWPHYYDCMRRCKSLGSCYAGDMHVNIGDPTNSNSYVFATGGSYFVGSDLLQCILENPVYVELDGLDFGEDKMVGKMIHFNKCKVQYVSCKWFNNREVYSPNAMVRMKKTSSKLINEHTELLSQEEQALAAASDDEPKQQEPRGDRAEHPKPLEDNARKEDVTKREFREQRP